VLDEGAAQELCQPASRVGCMNDLFIKYLCLEFWCRGMLDTAVKSAADHAPAAIAEPAGQLTTV